MKCSKILSCALSIVLCGCSGKIYVSNSAAALDTSSDKAAAGENSEKPVKERYVGIPFSSYKNQVETYYTDRILDEKGGVIALYTEVARGESKIVQCKPVEITETKVVVDTDPANIKYISYEPGFLEASTFNVDLSSGALSKVGMASTPALKTASDALLTVVTAARLAVKGEKDNDLRPLCTGGKIYAYRGN